MKTIGLDGSRAFLKYRTGIEEYSYQVIKHLRNEIGGDVRVYLYVRKKIRIHKGRIVFVYPEIDFNLPKNWKLVGIWAPRYWTQIGLSLQMFVHSVDTLFVPAHTLPLIGARRNVVTIHGLEYEITKESYGFWERLYMKFSIRYSCLKANTIIAVSENTKHDLMRLYGITEQKIIVIREGFVESSKELVLGVKETIKEPYFLFIGRIEERKNVIRIIEAFELFKEKYQGNEKLVLIGRPGYGYEKIHNKRERSKWKNDILEQGYVTQKEKQMFLSGATLFIFPSLYEGFGLPVLEAQAASIPVVTSDSSSLPEIGGEGALYVDPLTSQSIFEGIEKVMTLENDSREALVSRGRENTKRFSWRKCAEEVSRYLA